MAYGLNALLYVLSLVERWSVPRGPCTLRVASGNPPGIMVSSSRMLTEPANFAALKDSPAAPNPCAEITRPGNLPRKWRLKRREAHRGEEKALSLIAFASGGPDARHGQRSPGQGEQRTAHGTHARVCGPNVIQPADVPCPSLPLPFLRRLTRPALALDTFC